MKEGWARRQEQWRTFNEWGQAQLRDRGAPVDPVKWMGEAWELGQKADPTWGSSTNWEEHVRHLVRIREMLAKAFPDSIDQIQDKAFTRSDKPEKEAP